MEPAEAHEQSGQVDAARGQHSAHHEAPAQEPAQLVELASQRLDLGEDPRRARERDVPGIRQLDPPACADEEVDPKLALEPLHLL